MFQEMFFFIISATAISGISTREICFLPGNFRRTILPRERYGDSLSVSESDTQPSNWEADTVTELSPPQRNLRRQCLGFTWCCDVPLGRCWGTNESRKRIKLALTICRDFMQSLFYNVISFLCSNGLWLGWQKWFVWRGRCREWGTMAPQVSVSKKPWFQDKLWGTLAHWIWPRLLRKHFINFWFHSHMSRFFRLAYQSRAAKHKNWKELEVLTLLKIITKN